MHATKQHLTFSSFISPKGLLHQSRKMVTRTFLGSALLAAAAVALDDIPALGLGTWLSDRDRVPHAVEFGLKNGYEHIDAAWIYRASLGRIDLLLSIWMS